MNRERVELMAKMLTEVLFNSWKGGPAVREWAKRYEVKPRKTGNGIGFDLDHWVGADRSCGYSACAVGHACLDPRFIEQGLSIDVNSRTPLFNRYDNWDAIREFFGFKSRRTATILFAPSSYTQVKNGRIKTGVDGAGPVLARVMKLLEVGETVLNEQIDSENRENLRATRYNW